MSVAMSFSWQEPPSTLSAHLTSWEKRLLDAIATLAKEFAGRMESYMKQHAPWNDRTGAARRGLRAVAEIGATSFVLRVFHTVVYGVFLEFGTRHMAPRPILAPTIAQFSSAVMGELRQLVGQ